jgi:hypothetical protein
MMPTPKKKPTAEKLRAWSTPRERINRLAQHLILRRDEGVAADFPAAKDVARQASTLSQVVAGEPR